MSRHYLLIDPPGQGNVNLNGAKTRANNGSPHPIDHAHERISLDGTMALVHGDWGQEDFDWLIARGWAHDLTEQEARETVAGPDWEVPRAA